MSIVKKYFLTLKRETKKVKKTGQINVCNYDFNHSVENLIFNNFIQIRKIVGFRINGKNAFPLLQNLAAFLFISNLTIDILMFQKFNLLLLIFLIIGVDFFHFN